MFINQKIIERSSIAILLISFLVVAAGGIVEILPLFYIKTTVKEVKGVRPYSPLELAGRNIYIREGCYACHTQTVRSLREDVQRYGNYSLAAESMYGHPFQWGSKRTGPDLARIGGRYSNAWHVMHMNNPRSVIPASIMPAYPHLARAPLKYDDVRQHLYTHRLLSVPYDELMLANAKDDLLTQAGQNPEKEEGFLGRYPKAIMGDYDGNDQMISELDALIAYLQVLGTMAELDLFKNEPEGMVE